MNNIKPNLPGPPKFFKADRITEITYRKQADDYFPRLDLRLGEGICPKSGHPVWTSFKVYAHAPTLEHPKFEIKICLANKKGGSVFTQISVIEFDNWLSHLNEWRQKYDFMIKKGCSESLELTKRSHTYTTVGSILSDLTLPSSIVDHVIEDKDLKFPKKPSGKAIERPDISPQDIVNTLISLANLHKSAKTPYMKEYFQKQMRCLISENLEQAFEVKRILNLGEHPQSIVDQFPEFQPPSIFTSEGEETITQDAIDNEEKLCNNNETDIAVEKLDELPKEEEPS